MPAAPESRSALTCVSVRILKRGRALRPRREGLSAGGASLRLGRLDSCGRVARHRALWSGGTTGYLAHRWTSGDCVPCWHDRHVAPEGLREGGESAARMFGFVRTRPEGRLTLPIREPCRDLRHLRRHAEPRPGAGKRWARRTANPYLLSRLNAHCCSKRCEHHPIVPETTAEWEHAVKRAPPSR